MAYQGRWTPTRQRKIRGEHEHQAPSSPSGSNAWAPTPIGASSPAGADAWDKQPVWLASIGGGVDVSAEEDLTDGTDSLEPVSTGRCFIHQALAEEQIESRRTAWDCMVDHVDRRAQLASQPTKTTPAWSANVSSGGSRWPEWTGADPNTSIDVRVPDVQDNWTAAIDKMKTMFSDHMDKMETMFGDRINKMETTFGNRLDRLEGLLDKHLASEKSRNPQQGLGDRLDRLVERLDRMHTGAQPGPPAPKRPSALSANVQTNTAIPPNMPAPKKFALHGLHTNESFPPPPEGAPGPRDVHNRLALVPPAGSVPSSRKSWHAPPRPYTSWLRGQLAELEDGTGLEDIDAAAQARENAAKPLVMPNGLKEFIHGSETGNVQNLRMLQRVLRSEYTPYGTWPERCIDMFKGDFAVVVVFIESYRPPWWLVVEAILQTIDAHRGLAAARDKFHEVSRDRSGLAFDVHIGNMLEAYDCLTTWDQQRAGFQIRRSIEGHPGKLWEQVARDGLDENPRAALMYAKTYAARMRRREAKLVFRHGAA